MVFALSLNGSVMKSTSFTERSDSYPCPLYRGHFFQITQIPTSDFSADRQRSCVADYCADDVKGVSGKVVDL